MPAGDKTGPMGQGKMTGGAAGSRTENDAPRYMNWRPWQGGGLGWGRNRGFGWGRQYPWGSRFRWAFNVGPAATREQELELLKQQAEYFKAASEQILARIKELEASTKEE